jgi:hypothetical protein
MHAFFRVTLPRNLAAALVRPLRCRALTTRLWTKPKAGEHASSGTFQPNFTATSASTTKPPTLFFAFDFVLSFNAFSFS